MTDHSRLRRSAVLLGAAAALLTAAPSAHADSIAYVQAGDVYLSTSDGARQHRLTVSGGYSDVTQADDGTLVALHGVRLHRLDRGGTLLADFDTPVSDTRPAGQRVFYGPFDPALSPDGRKLSYTYYYVGKGTAPGCTPPTCMTTVTEGGTGYSHADRQTAWDEPGLGRHSGWRNATWLDDRTTMISDPTHLPNADVLLDTVGDTGVPIMDWFSDNGTQHLGAGEMDRGRTKLAFQAGEGDSAMRIYRMTGAYPALPEPCFEYSGPVGGSAGAPTWSPDGRRLAWAEGDGVRVVDVPDLAGGCTTAGASAQTRLLLPGATQPDWGPADVPAGPGRVPGGGGAGGGSTPGATPGGTSGAGAGVGGKTGGSRIAGPRPAAVEGISLRVRSASLAGGMRLTVQAPAAGRLRATAKVGRTTIATAKTHGVEGARATTVVLRVTPAGRALLRRKRTVRATVTVTFVRSGGATTKVTKTVTVKGGRR